MKHLAGIVIVAPIVIVAAAVAWWQARQYRDWPCLYEEECP